MLEGKSTARLLKIRNLVKKKKIAEISWNVINELVYAEIEWMEYEGANINQ